MTKPVTTCFCLACDPKSGEIGRECTKPQTPIAEAFNTVREALEQQERLHHLIDNQAARGLTALTTIENAHMELVEALKFYADPQIYRPNSFGNYMDVTFKAKAILTKYTTNADKGDAE